MFFTGFVDENLFLVFRLSILQVFARIPGMASSEQKSVPADLPREPLDIQTNSRGLMPSIGLHARGHLYVQESSYSHFGFGALTLVAAGALALSTWDARSASGAWPLKYVIAGGLVWAGLCGFAPYWVRNAFGQKIIVDPIKRTWAIRRRSAEQVVSWDDVLGLQICRQVVSSTSKLNGYQLNLIWRDDSGGIQRHCLFKHALRAFVRSLGNRYRDLFRVDLFDQTDSD